MRQAYKNLHDYGIIGDCHTAALVGIDGSIDWFCYPTFDSPSVFAAILDHEKGGHFHIEAAEHTTRKQLYFPDTNVLITRFLSADGVGEVRDFMPIATGRETERHRIIRRATSVRGEVAFTLSCRPAFDYARAPHKVVLHKEGAVFRSADQTMALLTKVRLQREGPEVHAAFRLKPGQSSTFVFEGVPSPRGYEPLRLEEHDADRALRDTVRYWRTWLASSKYRGRWREMVNRSALVLKLLCYKPTGALVAAPTCSLPERIGGERNWDYRYTWIRDAAFTIYALLRIGFTEEARDFMGWLLARTSEQQSGAPLQPVYGIDGRRELDEEILAHLDGYRKSRPVRIGNAAADQLQLDIYGAVMDAVYLYNKYGSPISFDLWTHLRRILDWVSDHWKDADKGIWEVRSGPHRFVYSNMMCWVALDRGIRLADKRGFPADVDRWRKARDAIYEEVMAKGWSEKRQAFVQYYGSAALDASNLLMPLVFFVSPTDPRMLKTLDAILRELVFDNLVSRYSMQETQDGLRGSEGTFSLCTFWLVEALTRAGRLEDARIMFEKMLGYANHLGLYAEELSPSGDALGNFPQAFTHLALISAAVNLDRALGGEF